MNRQMPALLKPFVALTYVLLLMPLVGHIEGWIEGLKR